MERRHVYASQPHSQVGRPGSSPSDYADMAYHASWHESQKTAKEVWVAPQGMSAEHVPQSVASFDFDEKRHAFLVSTAPNEREAQRLRRCAQPHANGFITAVPSEEDGRDTLLKPRVFALPSPTASDFRC